MSNIIKAIPEVEIEFDGRVRKIRLTLGVLGEVEKLTGKNSLSPKNNIWNDMSTHDLLCIVWVALKRNEPELTFEKVGDLLGIADIERLMKAVGEAFALSAPTPEKKAEAPTIAES